MTSGTDTTTRAVAPALPDLTALPDTPDADVAGAVQRALAHFLAGKQLEAAAVDEAWGEAVGALRDMVVGGGKRLRPTFAWWGWRGAGGDPHGPQATAVLRAVSALELVQACALVHDDLMDASSTRRGRPTVHVAFGTRHAAAGWFGASDRFGLAGAVLLGDVALAWADDMLRAAGLAPEPLRRAVRVWEAMRTEVLGGQYLDVLTQATGSESCDDALRVVRFKTAGYTVERPLQLGAAIAGAPAELITAYRRFGVDVGTAFQLRDDLLGVFGDPAVTGKPAGDDLREGKRTVLIALALRAAGARGATAPAARLRAALGRPDLPEPEVDVVRSILVELGAVAEVEATIGRLTTAALATLARARDTGLVTGRAADRLAELARAAADRAC